MVTLSVAVWAADASPSIASIVARIRAWSVDSLPDLGQFIASSSDPDGTAAALVALAFLFPGCVVLEFAWIRGGCPDERIVRASPWKPLLFVFGVAGVVAALLLAWPEGRTPRVLRCAAQSTACLSAVGGLSAIALAVFVAIPIYVAAALLKRCRAGNVSATDELRAIARSVDDPEFVKRLSAIADDLGGAEASAPSASSSVAVADDFRRQAAARIPARQQLVARRDAALQALSPLQRMALTALRYDRVRFVAAMMPPVIALGVVNANAADEPSGWTLAARALVALGAIGLALSCWRPIQCWWGLRVAAAAVGSGVMLWLASAVHSHGLAAVSSWLITPSGIGTLVVCAAATLFTARYGGPSREFREAFEATEAVAAFRWLGN